MDKDLRRNHGEGRCSVTPNQRIWSRARDRLAAEAASLGYPGEFADLLAKQLGSPKAIDRMTGYLEQAKPTSVEMIVDEMLAIRAEIDQWKKKKESEQAQAGYSAWLNSREREDMNGDRPD